MAPTVAYPLSPGKLQLDSNYELWEFKMERFLIRFIPITQVDVIINLIPDCILSQIMYNLPEDSKILLEIVRKHFYLFNGIVIPEKRRPTLSSNLDNSDYHKSKEINNLTDSQSDKKNGSRDQGKFCEVNGNKLVSLSQTFPTTIESDRLTLGSRNNTRMPETEKISGVIAKVPTSLEEPLDREKVEAELSKSNFISKEEEHAEDLRRRQAEVQDQHDRILENKKQREVMEKARDDSLNYIASSRINRRARICDRSPRYRRSTADSKSRAETSLEQKAEAAKDCYLGQKRLTKRLYKGLWKREAKQKCDDRHWSEKPTQLNSGSVEILQECTIPPEG